MSDLVTIDKSQAHVALVTLNRPEAMNALSAALRAQLAASIEDLEQDPDIRVMILTGAGERAFTAGLDLKELGARDGDAAITIAENDPVIALSQFSGPIIGAINGVAITGGFELALACDVLIGTPNTRFADTHARVGILPGWGLSQKLARLIGPYKARELSFTGNFVAAEQALAWGLLNHVVAPDALIETARAMAEDMLSCEADCLTAYKALINDGYRETLGAGLDLEQRVSVQANQNVEGAAIEARREAIRQRGQSQR